MPTAPTAAPGTNTTQIANAAFVKASIDAYMNESEVHDIVRSNPFSKAELNTTYGSKKQGFRLYCPNIGPGVLYIKPFANAASDWRSIQMESVTI